MDIDRLQGREDVAELLEQLSVLTLRHLTDHRELSFTAAATLARLDRAGPARLTALAAAEGVTQPSMTQLVQRLERQGLVTRVSDPDDGRVALIAVTDEGRALLAAHKQGPPRPADRPAGDAVRSAGGKPDRGSARRPATAPERGAVKDAERHHFLKTGSVGGPDRQGEFHLGKSRSTVGRGDAVTDLLAVWTDEHGCHPRGGCHGPGRKGHHTSAVPDSWVRTAARRGVAGSSFVGERGQSTCAHQHKNAHQHRTKGAARHAPDGQERPRSTLADGSLPSPRCPPLIPPTPAEIARLFHVRDQRADVIEHALHRSCFRPDAKPRPDAITSSDPQDPSFTVMLKRVSTSTSGVRMKVLVIGGGPAGSVTATGLAQAGLEVALVEGAEFPRYHIGESLTPSCRAVLEAVGVAKKLDENGFVIKHGGVFQWNSDTWVFDWAKQIGVRSWQVDRSQFDALLLQHARDNGVSVRTGVLAKSVEFDGARPAAVHCQPKDGDAYVIDDFDFLVDASGRHGLLSSRHFGDRQPLQNLRNIAIWGYWTGATMLPDTPIGGINIISSDEGWYWVIPLADGRISIGYVTTKDAFARGRVSGESLDDLYHRLVAASQTVGGLVADAEHVSTARTETDYSYIADRFCGPGFAIVGDAACFLDPLLSTGVHLALYSALTAAACIASIGRGEATEDEGLLFFEFAYRRAYTRLFALVSVMYERYLGKDGFFRTSDRLIGDDVEEHPIDGLSSTSFAEIIGGLSDLREVTDSSTRVLTDRLRDEALKVQLRALGDAAGASMPDFTSIRENPLRDAESAHFRLVTEPELGLERIGGQQS